MTMGTKKSEQQWMDEINRSHLNDGISCIRVYRKYRKSQRCELARAILKCNVCGNTWDTTASRAMGIKGRKRGCPECWRHKATHFRSTEYLKKEYLTYCDTNVVKKEYDILKSDSKIVVIKCKSHGDQRVKITAWVQSHRCPECVKETLWNKEKIKQYILDYSDYSLISFIKYSRGKSTLLLHCPLCNKNFVVNFDKLRFRNQGCPCQTTESYGERVISNFLMENENIVKYDSQVATNIKGRTHIFDFVITDKAGANKYIIEIDGDLHRTPYHKGNTEELKDRLSRDKDKDLYAEHHNIRMIRLIYRGYQKQDPLQLISELRNAHPFFKQLKVKHKLTPLWYWGSRVSEIVNYTLKYGTISAGSKYSCSATTINRYCKIVYPSFNGSKVWNIGYSEKDIANLYLRMDAKSIKKLVTTSGYFAQLSEPTIRRIFKHVYNCDKKQYISNHPFCVLPNREKYPDRFKIAEYYKGHTMGETVDEFNINRHRVNQYYKYVYHCPKGESRC